jgi:hypothetical protein
MFWWLLVTFFYAFWDGVLNLWIFSTLNYFTGIKMFEAKKSEKKKYGFS